MPSFNVYTIDGSQVKAGAANVEGLDKGIYIANGKKLLVRKV